VSSNGLVATVDEFANIMVIFCYIKFLGARNWPFLCENGVTQICTSVYIYIPGTVEEYVQTADVHGEAVDVLLAGDVHLLHHHGQPLLDRTACKVSPQTCCSLTTKP
jgi:hypothetical protein